MHSIPIKNEKVKSVFFLTVLILPEYAIVYPLSLLN